MLPEGWKETQPANIVAFFNGFAFKSTDTTDQGIKWLKISNVTPGGISWKECNYLPVGFCKKYRDFLVKKGDVVVALTRPIINNHLKIGRLESEDDLSLLNQRVAKIVPKNGNYLDYIYHLFRSDDFSNKIQQALLGTDPPNLSMSVLKRFLLPLPPLSEQKKIAAILSTWDCAIEGMEKLLANSQQQKKALMQQLLTGKKRLPGFTEEWKTRTLGEIGEISSAGVDKKSVDGEEPVRLLNFTDVFKRTFIYSDDLHQWVTAPSRKVQKCNVKKGDVFFTPSSETRNDIAFSAVAAENMQSCCYSYHVVRLRFKEKWDDAFKAFIFSTMSFRKQVYKLADGSGQRYVISQDDFRSIEISYPSLDEQRQIGALLHTAENEMTAIESDLLRLRQEKKALMQQLLTGKCRVKVN